MKVLPFENSVSEELKEEHGDIQNMSKVSWTAHREFSNGDCPMSSITLNISTLSSREDYLSSKANGFCKKVMQGDIMTYCNLRGKVQNKPETSKNTNTYIEPFCIAPKRKCQGN